VDQYGLVLGSTGLGLNAGLYGTQVAERLAKKANRGFVHTDLLYTGRLVLGKETAEMVHKST